jgi:hypothetical protein
MTRRAPTYLRQSGDGEGCKGAAVDAGLPSAQAAAIATPRKPRNHPPIGLPIGAAAAIII